LANFGLVYLELRSTFSGSFSTFRDNLGTPSNRGKNRKIVCRQLWDNCNRSLEKFSQVRWPGQPPEGAYPQPDECTS